MLHQLTGLTMMMKDAVAKQDKVDFCPLKLFHSLHFKYYHYLQFLYILNIFPGKADFGNNSQDVRG